MRPRTLLLIGLGYVALAGCNSILGLDKFQVTHGTGVGAVGGSGGTGGNATGGSGAGGVDAGGAGATAGTGGTGGVPACGGSLTPNKRVVETCILRASCSPFIPDATISTCITLNLQQAFIGTACTQNAANCKDVDLCQGYGYTDSTQCPSGQTGWRCENNYAINCTQGYYISCAKLGGQCQMYDSNGDSYLDTADCKVLDSCVNGSGCQGDIAYTCVNGTGYGMACSNFGAQCDSQNGQPACYLATQSCSGSLTPCTGDTAQVCINGRKQSYDCASVGLGCTSDSSGPYCVAPGCTMTDANNCAESCTGSTAHLCYGGVPYDVDCKTYGFSTCTEHDDKAPPNGIGHYVVCSN